MDTVLRVATAGDEAAIRRLFVEMLRTIFHTQEVEGYPAGYVGRFFTGGEDKILVAEQAGMVVGFLSLESHREGEPPFLSLDDFSVTAACRGQGIGSRLLDMAEEYAAALELGKSTSTWSGTTSAPAACTGAGALACWRSRAPGCCWGRSFNPPGRSARARR